MKEETKQACECGKGTSPSDPAKPSVEMFPIYKEPAALDACCEKAADSGRIDDPDEPCCGPPAGPPSSPHERPGYAICHFVSGFLDTPAGKVPQIKPSLSTRDRMGSLAVRLSLGRDNYKVAPGLYAIGVPGPDSPVLVTANYKLSFDPCVGIWMGKTFGSWFWTQGVSMSGAPPVRGPSAQPNWCAGCSTPAWQTSCTTEN